MADALFDPEDFAKERTSVIAELHSYDDPRSRALRRGAGGQLRDPPLPAQHDRLAHRRGGGDPRRGLPLLPALLPSEQRRAGDRGRRRARGRDGEGPRAFRGAARGGRDHARPHRGAAPDGRAARESCGGRDPHARVLAAFRAPALADPDFAVMVLFDALLAGGKGFRFTRDYPNGRHGAAAPRRRGGRRPKPRGHSQWQAARDPYVYTLGADVPGRGHAAGRRGGAVPRRARRRHRGSGRTRRSPARCARCSRDGPPTSTTRRAGRTSSRSSRCRAGTSTCSTCRRAWPGVTRDDLRRFAAARLTREQATVGWFVPATPSARSLPAVASAANAPGDAPAPPGRRPPSPPTRRRLPRRRSAGRGCAWPTAYRRLAPAAGGTLVTLRGRIEAGAMFDGGTPGLSALATELLARPVPGEPPRGAPRCPGRCTRSRTRRPRRRWIEFSASALAGDLPDAAARPRGPVARGRWRLRAAGAWSRRNGRRSRRRPPTVRGPTRPPRPPACGSRRSRRCTRPTSPLRRPAWGEPRGDRSGLTGGAARLRARQRAPGRARRRGGGREWTRRPRGARCEVRLGTLAGAPGGAAVRSAPRRPARRSRPGGIVRLPRPGKSQDDIRVVVPGDRVAALGRAPRPSCCCTCSARPGTRAGWARRSWIPGSCTPSTRRGRRKGPRGS